MGQRRPLILGYGVAVLSIAAGIVNVTLLQSTAHVGTFVLAVLLSAWFGGARPGILATALAIPVLLYILPPGDSFAIDPGQIQRIAFFLVIASFIVWTIASERKAVESLRSMGDELRLVIDTIPAMAWTLRSDGQLEFLNRRCLEYSGLSPEEGLARAMEAIHPEDARPAIEKWKRALAAGAPYEDEMRLRRADGEYRWFLVRTVPLVQADGTIARWYATSTDIEDRKSAERALRDSAERLQQLTHRLLEVQEDERRHLSRELHDEFGQVLTAAKLHLHAAESLAGPAAHGNLRQAAEALQRAGEQVHNLALELRPTMLETAGFDATLRWLADQHEQRTNIVTNVAGRVNHVPADQAIACFRVAQEALTNVAEHSGAKLVRIDIGKEEGRVEMMISDNGAGFDVAGTLDQGARRGHLGLLGMRERVQILGGSLQIESKPGHGTRIHVSLPLPPAG